MSESSTSLPPIFIDCVLDDPGIFRDLIERHSPYWPVQRYFANDAEYRASSGGGQEMIIAPNFRGDWAYDTPLVDGADSLLEHAGFANAAAQMFDTSLVRPQIVYTNLPWQLPFDQGGGHTDIPAFRGVERTHYPIWILNAMGHSRLFEPERVQIATAVAWFYRGTDGGFTYWPDGPDRPPKIHEGDIFNTAVVGDNDRMYHRVRPVGARDKGFLMGMTLDTRLEHRGGDDWIVSDADERRAELCYDDLRISVSWKAQVFRDEHERKLYDEHLDDIGIDEVFERFYDDLDARGVPFKRSNEPLDDPEIIDLLAQTYVREPTVFESRG
ncbi:MAG: hypothetical protein AAEJ52_03635 [Myxococcota bacterium]